MQTELVRIATAGKTKCSAFKLVKVKQETNLRLQKYTLRATSHSQPTLLVLFAKKDPFLRGRL